MHHDCGAVSIIDFLDLSRSHTAITDVRFLLAVTAVRDQACSEFHPLRP